MITDKIRKLTSTHILLITLILVIGVGYAIARDRTLTSTTSPGISVSSGTGSLTEKVMYNEDGSVSLKRYKLTWLSTAGGAFACTITNLRGLLTRVTFDPDASSTQPDDLYDQTFIDDSGVDVFVTLGSNISNATSTTVCPFIGDGTDAVPISLNESSMSYSLTGAGAANGGSTYFYLKP